MSLRAVTTTEIDLGHPAGLPQPRPREALSEITSITTIRVSGKKRAMQLAGIGAGAALLIALMMTGEEQQQSMRTPPPPPPPAAPALVPTQVAEPELPAMPTEAADPAAADQLPANDNSLFEVSMRSRPLVEKAPKAEKNEAPSVETPKLSSGSVSVELRSDPRTVVYAGERRLGRTPLTTELPAGTHELRFVSRRIRLDETKRIHVKGPKSEKTIYFGVSKLNLEGPEGAKVYIDGKYAGELPLETIELAEGRHRLKVKHDGTLHTEMLRIPASRTIDYRMSF